MVKTILKWTVLLAGGGGFSILNQTVAQVQYPDLEADAVPNVVLVQFADGTFPVGKQSGLALFDAIANSYGVYAIEPTFPHLHQNGVSCDNMGKLSNTYRVHFSEDTPPELLALVFESDPGVVYAEAEYYYRTTASTGTSVPNDPDFAYQATYMDRLQLKEAWDTVKGEQGKIMVAIIDSGTDWRHEDLIANVWTNTDEIPDNGIDDDKNGYVDDVHGYDFGNKLPYTPGVMIDLTFNNHGTAVASVTSGESNNAKGVAGSSWNATYMPIGADCGSAGICNIAEATLYAAVNGADIINGSFTTSIYHATHHLAVQCAMEMGTLFVAAAGNDGTNNDVKPQSPASFFETLAVGGTERSRDRVVFNYGSTVDVFASGSNLATALPNNEYGRLSGTSFASPLVAGIAALVKTRFPHFSAEQVREQIRYTSETIEDINPSGFEGLLGRGRVNAYQAVQTPVSSAIRVTGIKRKNSSNNSSQSLVVDVESFFESGTSQSASVELVDIPSYLGFERTSHRIDFPTGAGMDSVMFPFSFLGAPPYRVRDQMEVRVAHNGVTEKINYSFESRTGETLPVVKIENALGYSITSEGNLGYLDQWGNSGGLGIGVGLLAETQLNEAGLIIGTGPEQISSSVLGHKKSYPGKIQPIHFNRKPGTKMDVSVPGVNGILSTQVTLLDSNAPHPIGVEILEETQLVTNDDESGGFIIVKYTVTNLLQVPIENLHVGLYADWILSFNWTNDQPRFDAEREAIYQITEERNPWVPGIKILSEDSGTRYGALINYGIYPGTWRSIMWGYLSGENRLGGPSSDNWSHIASVGPIRLEPGAHKKAVFAVINGKSEEAFLELVDHAVEYWGNRELETPGYVQIINATDIQLDLYLDNAATPKTVPEFSSSDYIPIHTGLTKLAASGSGTLHTTIPVISNLEVTGDSSYQVIYSGGKDQIRATIACCARDRATTTEVVALRASHNLTGHSALSFRFASDQGFVENLQVAAGTASSYIDLPPDKYSLEISKNGTPWLHSRIDLHNFGGEALLLMFVPQGSNPPRIAAFEAKEENVRFWLNFTEVSTSAEQSSLPLEFMLHGNYPNPVNSAMRIHFDLPTSARVSLEIIDLLGKRVREISAGEMDAGFGASISVDSRGLSSGAYLYRLTMQSSTGTFTDAGRFIVIR